ncbi:DUF4910 domain-containing protein [Nostoc sp. NIES-2111]
MGMRTFIRDHYTDLRSITGEGNRRLLHAVQERFLPQLQIHEVPSGTRCLDWVVPPEWTCRSARLIAPDGKVVVDFAENNLHILNYSVPFTGTLSWDELEPHLHSLPQQPELIPYKTSYYHRTWGLCLAENVKKTLPRKGQYRVEIDTELNEHGSLTYGEWFLPGESEQEIFFSTHICHPRLAIDNLSSVAALAELGRRLSLKGRPRLGIRMVFVPGTIGPVVWLASRAGWEVQPPAFAYVLALAGAPGPLHLKEPGPGRQTSFLQAKALAEAQGTYEILPYEPYGYDERQYNTLGPGFQAVRIGRANYGGYPQYHTSADDLDLLSEEGLNNTLSYLEALVDACQDSTRYTSLVRAGEPQYSRHGAFEALPAAWPDKRQREQAMYWLMSHAQRSLLTEIEAHSGLPMAALQAVADVLVQKGLLAEE